MLVGDSGADTYSGSTFKSDSDGPADHVGESELEEGEEEDIPLMVDPIMAYNISDYSYLNVDSVKEMKITWEYKCSCKLYNSGACYKLFTPEEMERRRDLSTVLCMYV